MGKITLSINKLSKLFLFAVLACGGAYAQCPTNITIASDEGQCGAIVTYAVAGGGATQSPNGIVNGNASNGLTGWTNSTAFGSAWVASGSNFVSSYNLGSMSQVIDLTTMGMTDAYMDTMPAITISEDYEGGWPNYSDTYSLTVELRGEADNVLATYTTGTVTCTSTWQTASHVFTGYPTGVRKIFFQHSGDDIEFWAGNYGATVTNASVTVAVPTSTVSQTAGIASGALFPIGTTTNTFTVTDEDNVVSTCTFDVTVTDGEAPVALAQNITVELNADGVATVTAAAVDNGSTDNCTNLMLSLSTTEFTCENLGANTVTLTAADGTNTTTATATVTVVDNIDPVAVFNDVVFQLGADGTVSFTAEDMGSESTDNCSIATYVFSKQSFSCEDIGENTVTLTVTDNGGNTATTTATVTIQDILPPTVVTQNITLTLPEITMISISALDIDNGSVDNCGITSYSLDNQVFTCENIGVNTVTLSITDNYGNVSTGTATVTIEDPNNYCQTAGVANTTLNNAVSVYPNPTNGQITIEAGNYTINKIELYDISARLVKTLDINAVSGIYTGDMSVVNAGIYFVKLYSADAFVIKRIVKQ